MISTDDTTLPFNNSVETGLRVLVILYKHFPKSIDVTRILYYDYMLVHSGDINENVTSLHPSVPYRRGELLIRKSIIQEGLDMLVSRGLVEIIYSPNGIEYVASEYSAPFIESLSSPYSEQLIIRADWLASEYPKYNMNELHRLLDDTNDSFDLEILD